MSSEKKILRTLFGVIFLDQTYLTITFPLITLIFFDPQSRLFHPDTAYAERSLWYGICVALPNIINMFFAPLLSALSDEFGRKKILMIEVFSAFIFTLAVGFGIYLGILGLVFLGFVVKGAFSRINPTALAIVGDAAPKEKKILYMGHLQFFISAGACLGPILGGYFAHRFFFPQINFSLPFFIAAGLALFNTLIAIAFIRETLKKQVNKPWANMNFRAITDILTHQDVLRISLILLLIQSGWSLYYQFIPPILKTHFHFDSETLGLFIGMIAFWLAMATGIGIRLLHRYLSVRHMLLVSVYLILLGLGITLLACNHLLPAIWVWIGAIPTASGDVIAYSCLTALYSNAVLHETQGKVMGVALIVVASTWAATGFLGGFFMSLSPLLPLAVAPVGILISLLLIHRHFGKTWALDYHTAT